MKNCLPSIFGLTALFLVMCQVCGAQEAWHNCTADSCNATLHQYPCSQTVCRCECGVPSSNPSTCTILPSHLANQTGAPLSTSSGSLTCCLCKLNMTFFCQSCSSTPTPTATLMTTATTPVATSSLQYAKLVAVFVLDCRDKYTSNINQMALWFSYAIGNLTSTDNTLVNVTQVKCVHGNQPYCGVDHSVLKAPYGVRTTDAEHTTVPCKSLTINAMLQEDASRAIQNTIAILESAVKNGTFIVPLWDGSTITVTFLLSGLSNTSYVLHEGPDIYRPTVTSTKDIPPLQVNLKPLIYTGAAVAGLVSLCVVWQLVKQSYLLRRKKFTNINSDRINSKKIRVLEVMRSQEGNNEDPPRGQFDMTHRSLPRVDNDALTRHYDWTSPGYLPSMLAPAYKPTEFHGQQSPLRLILDDDEDSDLEKKSVGKASVINIDEDTDEDLRDIFESEDEYDRPNSKRSNLSSKASHKPHNKSKSSNTSKKTRKSSTTSFVKPRKASEESKGKSPSENMPGKKRKCSYMGPEGRNKSSTPSFGTLKANRVTPVSGDRKPSVTSLKPPKKTAEQSYC